MIDRPDVEIDSLPGFDRFTLVADAAPSTSFFIASLEVGPPPDSANIAGSDNAPPVGESAENADQTLMIVLIVIAALVVVCLIILVVFAVYRKHQKNKILREAAYGMTELQSAPSTSLPNQNIPPHNGVYG